MPGSDVVIKAKWSKITISKSMDGTVKEKSDPIIQRFSGLRYSDAFKDPLYLSKISSVVTKDNIEIPSYVVESWDVSEAKDGSVIAYIENDGSGGYKLTIGGEGGIIANPDSSSLFGGLSMDGYNYANLKTVDLTYFDTSRVTNMSSMFDYGFSGQTSNGSQLHTIIFGDKWDTSQVTDMSFMFSGQEQLTSLDLSSFDTSRVTDMMSMFSWCSSLTNLDIRNATFNTTSYSYMFDRVPNGITITVKDTLAKNWIEARLNDAGKTGNVIIG